MTSQHSPEPWVAQDDFVIDANGESVGLAVHNPSPLNVSREDADRIIACVNTCAGIPTNELHKLKAWLSDYRKLYQEGGTPK